MFRSEYFWHDTFGKYWHRLVTCRNGCAERRNVNDCEPMEPIRLHCFQCERSMVVPREYEEAIKCWEAVRALTNDEVEVVQIIYPNPDFTGPAYAIDVMGDWVRGDYHGLWRRFTSDDSILDCLQQAVRAKQAVLRNAEIPPRDFAPDDG